MDQAFVHPTSVVESEEIGIGTRVWAFTHIMRGARIGDACNIGSHCFIESGAIVGDRATIKNGNMIWEGIEIGDGAFVGPGVTFTNDRYPRSPRLPDAEPRYADASWLVRTQVREGASIGAAAVVTPGVTVGAFALVAAGSLVTRDIPAHTLVSGVPAAPVGFVCRCGLPITLTDDRATCDGCSRRYSAAGDSIEEDA